MKNLCCALRIVIKFPVWNRLVCVEQGTWGQIYVQYMTLSAQNADECVLVWSRSGLQTALHERSHAIGNVVSETWHI